MNPRIPTFETYLGSFLPKGNLRPKVLVMGGGEQKRARTCETACVGQPEMIELNI